ncbi:hypothetical protein FE840_011855 [Peteryoungia desertarenae]|uniref:Uncharacterized protein n=1 Tax=Peteryoungia desertarenae TaxID=1813451 RepID=A0ABX6QNL8_9HYPH|nr:hypothetical protein [Peteryoungia desertarenae]QLF70176.1 hypothetical protein FE840_011855 [Peteryoungia desertarenae]
MAIKILDYRPAEPGRGNAIARLDIEFPSGVRLFHMKLVKTPKGYRVYSPSAFGTPTANFPPSMAEAIIKAAMPFVTGEMTTHDQSAA